MTTNVKKERIVLYGDRVSVGDDGGVVEVGLGPAPRPVVVRRILVESEARAWIEVLDVSVPHRSYLWSVSARSPGRSAIPGEGVGLSAFERLRFRIPLRPTELLVVRLDVGREDAILRVLAECDAAEVLP